jgi:hypothetical protein
MNERIGGPSKCVLVNMTSNLQQLATTIRWQRECIASSPLRIDKSDANIGRLPGRLVWQHFRFLFFAGLWFSWICL